LDSLDVIEESHGLVEESHGLVVTLPADGLGIASVHPLNAQKVAERRAVGHGPDPAIGRGRDSRPTSVSDMIAAVPD